MATETDTYVCVKATASRVGTIWASAAARPHISSLADDSLMYLWRQTPKRVRVGYSARLQVRSATADVAAWKSPLFAAYLPKQLATEKGGRCLRARTALALAGGHLVDTGAGAIALIRCVTMYASCGSGCMLAEIVASEAPRTRLQPW